MTEPTRSSHVGSHLARLASRLSADAQFMANALVTYQSQERLNDQALAERLGLTPAMLARLALCRRPQPAKASFGDQVRQIATYTGVDAGKLANLIHEVDAVQAMNALRTRADDRESDTEPASTALGWLAAARDRTDPDQDGVKSAPEDGSGTE